MNQQFSEGSGMHNNKLDEFGRSNEVAVLLGVHMISRRRRISTSPPPFVEPELGGNYFNMRLKRRKPIVGRKFGEKYSKLRKCSGIVTVRDT